MKLKDEAVAALQVIITNAIMNGKYTINQFDQIEVEGMVVGGHSLTNHVSIGVGFDNPELAKMLERMEKAIARDKAEAAYQKAEAAYQESMND